MTIQAPFELTEGQSRLEKILSSFPAQSPHWNEAQNRFQFIDRLLTECLGWEKPNIEVEDTDELGGRADYLLGRPVRAVLEAKKEARTFNVPPVGKPSAVRKLQPLIKSCKVFDEAVRQVIPYCSIRGVQIGIVCNGPQLALFQAMTMGQSPLEGECFFFDGFETYLNEFPLLWSLLSPDGISENRAYRDLALHRNPRIPPKASEGIPEPHKYRYRSQFQENLRSLSSVLLEEIEDNPELKPAFYRECYVPIDANNRHLLLSKSIIASRYKRSADNGIVPDSIETVTHVDNARNFHLSDGALDSAGSRPIVVLGDVGVGKTSFFENLYEHLEASEKANTYFIHINLGIRANLSADIKTHVLSEIPSVLRTRYGVDIDDVSFVNAIYHQELVAFDRSVKGGLKAIDQVAYQKEKIAFLQERVDRKDSHLQAALGHLARGRDKQIILVMDNADQRKFEVQQEAFLIAQELASSRNLLVFVALRPSTFYQSKMSGALSGYQNKVLVIAPPPADQVLERRITFALRVAEGKISPAALTGIRLQLNSVVSFLRAALRSIKTNESIRQFLGNITGGNTRSVIELFTGFCGSPNVDSEKIVRIEESEGNYKVPLHEFTKHALLGEYAYFNSQSSLVACNIFDVGSADPREHFLASLIIAFLNSNLGQKNNDGFVSGHSVLREMAVAGFTEDQIRYSLRRLATKRLIETPHAHYREIGVPDDRYPEEFYFRATSVGIYHLRFWTGAFAFLDATSTDTPIFDGAVREEIFSLATSFTIEDRYRRAETFRRYLEIQWYEANLSQSYYDFVTVMRSEDESFRSVKNFIEKPRKPRFRKKWS